MCLIVFAYKNHPKYKLIFAANRDEFFDRESEQAHIWKYHPQLLAGKDLKEGGTWMGITKNGRFAAITNFRDMSKIKSDAESRGHIVKNFLLSGLSAEIFGNELKKTSNNFNGYNLIFGRIDDLYYFSNHNDELQKLSGGNYGLSNHLLNTNWPKVERSKELFSSIIKSEEINVENLFELLQDCYIPPDDQLPKTGLPYVLEKFVSTIFIKSEEYGTRCSTVVLVDKNNNVSFIERTFNANSFNRDEASFSFPLE